ncbi:hydroxymethylglutaryl-CoA synthase 1 isoform X1 [Homalodisca vitripennis]|uniref:hydroxymethylglutaryl-CoA synthase 1 isoform X1 n=2 Tax=Homalodisca vitripennis TaxID=197043 RepID=UPI001EEA7632|nr:hydroxymethylglutaryl-CoA synthase 1 isoform X1 [Homalodisca vitripennis]
MKLQLSSEPSILVTQNLSMGPPEDVGIVALELVVPAQCVDQAELEVFDGVSAGKYTVGLGQARMGFCTDREDINSLCLTAVAQLMEKNNLSYRDIGRLEVGTETIIDKSKSVKTVLMQLFHESGNYDVEGIDTTNACYGGTAALFNAVAWVESRSWDGRLAIVVAADIAVYAAGSARPTGGAGAVAMLIGPNASLAFEPGLRATFMDHVYDFFKPDLSSEYPTVDGKLSIQCYLTALDHCYQLYCRKAKKLAGIESESNDMVGVKSLDAVLFHTPYCKLVQKSLARLVLNDFVNTPKENIPDVYPGLEKYTGVQLEDTYFDRDVEKGFMEFSKAMFAEKTQPSLYVANQVGNMYTSSLYGGLVSYLINKPVSELVGKRIGLFSYGSGLASSMFSLKVRNEGLKTLVTNLSHIQTMLENRKIMSPKDFSNTMAMKEQNAHKSSMTPIDSVENLFPGTFYLKVISDYRRSYDRVPI